MNKNKSNDDTKVEDHGLTNVGKEQDKAPKVLKETDAQIMERQQQELTDLKAIALSQPKLDPADAKYMNDVDFLKKQKQGTNRIEIKEISDHKNISLWTAWGKRIGPLHPNNAVYTYHKFRRLGRILFVHKPSEESIVAYYKSPEYLKWKKKFDLDREKKIKSRSKDGLERVLNKMAEITGQTRDQLQSIIDRPGVAPQGG